MYMENENTVHVSVTLRSVNTLRQSDQNLHYVVHCLLLNFKTPGSQIGQSEPLIPEYLHFDCTSLR